MQAHNKLERFFEEHPSNAHQNGGLRRDIAYLRIREALQNADLEPGEMLSEVQLSRVLGISRTPIREALQRLEKEGLVEMVPGRAVTVASRSVKDVLDVLHIRMMLEPELARLVAENATAHHIDNLQVAISQMETAVREDNYAAWSKADSVFHDVMREACPNRLLGELIVQMRNRVHHLANTDSKHNPARLAACTVEHREIVDTIATRNAEAAEQVMRAHILKLRDGLLSRLTYGL
jgi:DNA-binding GntR family transcriptional regulator